MVAIQLSDEQAAALHAKAMAQGLTLEAWLQKLAGIDEGRGSSKPRYKLSELMSKCDSDAPLSQEDREWLETPPIGREA
jgi:hypothetical protein